MPIPDAIRSLLETSTPPELGPGPRPGIKSQAQLRGPLDLALSSIQLPADKTDLIRALILLWHDHLEPAHVLAQSIDNADGAFVHGIMHRREPDYGNAAYWFRHVGNHAAFAEIAQGVNNLKDQEKLQARLLTNGRWNPFAFIDACQSVAGRSNAGAEIKILQQVQRNETEALLQYFVGSGS